MRTAVTPVTHRRQHGADLAEPDADVPPGRRMIMAPAKPTKSAAQRRMRTFSPSSKMAPSVPNSGARKLMAVTSPIGMREMA